jgi:hypothetical protein
MTMMTVDGLDDYNDLLFFYWCLGLGWFWVSWLLGPLGLGFHFSFFSPCSDRVLQDLS